MHHRAFLHNLCLSRVSLVRRAQSAIYSRFKTKQASILECGTQQTNLNQCRESKKLGKRRKEYNRQIMRTPLT